MRVFGLSLLLLVVSPRVDPDLQTLRKLYGASDKSKQAADRMLKLLTSTHEHSPPLVICYLGAAQMMQANYGINPINKYSSFKKGRKLIEQAVSKEPKNIEIRYIRFTIQTNLPRFLAYSEHIESDKAFLIKGLKHLNDKELKTNIIKYLSASKYCNEQEKKEINT